MMNEKLKSFPSWSFQLDTMPRYAYWDNCFSTEECDTIIDYCKGNFTLQKGSVMDSEKYSSDRNSEICFINVNSEISWVYQRLTSVITNLNSSYFNFDLWGFAEGLQFTEYNSPGGKYDEHLDIICNGVIRKLSIVVQLTDENSYEGGDFQLLESSQPTSLSRNKGTLLVFPSFILHRVTPVTKGTRNSLVGWITGKPFK